jgi:catechol 2,3-dioxygenase-like lactoylglutathione lyase family enzyme
MLPTFSRRLFLTMTTSAWLAPRMAWPTDNETPPMLDHILLGCSDLNRGIAFVEASIGVRAAIGGVHPGRGTRNALLSLGGRRYLEIIAPDAAQDKIADVSGPLVTLLKSLETPRLVGWAAHPGDVEALAKRLRGLGIAIDGPRAGSRQRTDGRLLKWKTVTLLDDHQGVLPFFIEWDPNSPHPSTDAPAGCRLEHFAIADPEPSALAKTCKQLGLEVTIERAEKPQLRTRLARGEQNYEATT